MADRLKDRTAIVIGAARGIGAGIAARFVEEGARILLADADAEAGAARAAALGDAGRVRFRRVDIGDPEDVESLVSDTVEAFGGVDILVQNAGIYPWTLIRDISVAEWDRVLAVNLRGTFLAAKACFEVMRARRYGRMVFTSSITGPRVTSPGHGHYSASKAGMNGFIKAAALEFAPWGITVNGIEPGNILTEGVEANRSRAFIASMEQSIPLGRLGTSQDVANAALFLASDEASYVTGTTLIVDGGQTLPEGADFRIEPS